MPLAIYVSLVFGPLSNSILRISLTHFVPNVNEVGRVDSFVTYLFVASNWYHLKIKSNDGEILLIT